MGTVNGLPAHVLLVHAIVALLPLAALLLVLTALWPAARRRLAAANALLSVVVLVLVPITTSAGEWLERRVPETDLLHDHAELGDTALYYALPVTILALLIWWRHREAATAALTSEPTGGAGTGGTATMTRRRTYLAPVATTVTRVVAALAAVIAIAAVYGTYRIGDSGSKAVWTDNFSSSPTQEGTGRPAGG